MESTFSVAAHLSNLAEELIANFARAGAATTPGLVGSAREHEVRTKLKSILPGRMTVSTGCIIDSFGNTSNQTDVVIHERDSCPVFSINGADDVGYIPCEGVAAVGEIKSAMGKAEIQDAVAKIQKIKSLQRAQKSAECFRHYGNSLVAMGAPEEAYDPVNKPFDQIYGFILCHRFAVKVPTFIDHYRAAVQANASHLAPSMVISLSDGILMFYNSAERRLLRNALNADQVALFRHPGGDFQYLLHELALWCTNGRTTDVFPHTKYLLGPHANAMIQPQLFSLS